MISKTKKMIQGKAGRAHYKRYCRQMDELWGIKPPFQKGGMKMKAETLDEFRDIWVRGNERRLPVWIENPTMWVVWDSYGEYICQDTAKIYAIEKAQMIIEEDGIEDGIDNSPYFIGKATEANSLQVVNFNEIEMDEEEYTVEEEDEKNIVNKEVKEVDKNISEAIVQIFENRRNYIKQSIKTIAGLEDKYTELFLNKLFDESNIICVLEDVLTQRKQKELTKFDILFEEWINEQKCYGYICQEPFLLKLLTPILTNEKMNFSYGISSYIIVRELTNNSYLNSGAVGDYLWGTVEDRAKQIQSPFIKDMAKGLIDDNWKPLEKSLKRVSDAHEFINTFVKELKDFQFDMYILNQINDMYSNVDNELYEEFCEVGDPLNQCEIIRGYIERKHL